MRSPWFRRSVRALGVNVALLLSCGLGGPGGTPLVWTKAKLTGSTSAAYWVVELCLGALVITALSTRARSARFAAGAGLAVAATALVVYVVATSV